MVSKIKRCTIACGGACFLETPQGYFYLNSLVTIGLSVDGPIVEFFNPKLRPELEKNDTELMKKTGWKGAAPKGDSWVWLTSYSRIPFEAIEGFCKKTKEYCPPGPTGKWVDRIRDNFATKKEIWLAALKHWLFYIFLKFGYAVSQKMSKISKN